MAWSRKLIINFMNSEASSNLYINEYLQKLSESIPSTSSENPNAFYIFRGQSEKYLPLTCPSYRELASSGKLKQTSNIAITENDFYNLKHHDRKLIEAAKMRGHFIINGSRKLKDLEILADLRHYGCSTSLIDFTSNFLVALWFACGGYEKDKIKEDGEIFILDAGDTSHFLMVNNEIIRDKERGKVESLFDALKVAKKEDNYRTGDNLKGYNQIIREKLWYWIPENLNDRMRDQDCVFVFGTPFIKKNFYKKTIIVKKDDKENLLKDLEKYFNYSLDSLFSDKHGFAEHYLKNLNTAKDKIKYHYSRGMEFLAIEKEKDAEIFFQNVLKIFEEQGSKNCDKEIDMFVADTYFRLAKITANKIKNKLFLRGVDIKGDREKQHEHKRKEFEYIKKQFEYIKTGLKLNPSHNGLKLMAMIFPETQ